MPPVRLLPVLVALLIISACAASPSPGTGPTPTAAAGLNPADGEMVNVGGHALFLRCSGTGTPTVILEAGLDAAHTTWARVQPALAESTRVCSYDRAGLGLSAAGPQPRTSADVVADLEALLENAQIPGPYVLVAHSFGGLHARLFAHEHADDMAGLVLVDAIHEDYWSRALALLPSESANESERLAGFRRYLTSDVADPARNREGLDIPASAEQVRASGTLGTLPLIVLVAGRVDTIAPGLPPEVEAGLVQLLQQELPEQLTRLSSNSTRIVVPDSGHVIQQQRPDLVVTAVRAVLRAHAEQP